MYVLKNKVAPFYCGLLYRGTLLSKENVEEIRSNLNQKNGHVLTKHVVSTNFFSTSKSRAVALRFIKS